LLIFTDLTVTLTELSATLSYAQFVKARSRQ